MKEEFSFPGFVKNQWILVLVLTLSLPLNGTAEENSGRIPQDPQLSPGQPVQEKGKENKPSYPPNEILVKFKNSEDVHSPGIAEINEAIGVEQIEPVFNEGLISEENIKKFKEKFPERKPLPQDAKIQSLKNWRLIKYTGDADPVEACGNLREKSAEVEACQPNYNVKGYWIPNDPYFSSQGTWGQDYDDLWALKRNKLNMEAAWDVTRGDGIVVAVVDTGLDYNHPDIRDNVWSNPEEIPDNGIDDDENGYIDDVRGWSFVDKNNDPMDNHGHGTHVSGIIAARGNNNLGMIGAAPEAEIMPVKGLNNQGTGAIRDLANGILYATIMGARVINNSWGCTGRCPSNPIAEEAVYVAQYLGAVVVFAAGDSAEPVKFYSPQNMGYPYPKPIVVSAATEVDTPAFFSNFGELIDVAAPGAGRSYESRHNILSLRSNTAHPDFAPLQLRVEPGLLRQAGASMSAAYVSGVAALILAHRPSFTPDEVRHVLRLSADLIPGFEFSMGAGRINAARALTIESVPSLQAEINYPPSDTLMTLPCSYPILGVAAGNDFSRYQLFYRSQGVAAPWIPVSDPVSQPVEYGTLGTAVQCPPAGAYLLKLVVTSRSGRAFEKISRILFEPLILPVSLGPQIERPPSIDGGKIVWEDGGNRDIYLYDISTGKKRRITDTPSSFEQNPSISGSRITYLRRDDQYHLVLFDLATHQEKNLVSASAFMESPDIDGTRIAYVYNHSASEIRLYDISTHTETAVAVDLPPSYNSFPRISGNKIVWIKTLDFNQNVIFLYDLSTGKQREIMDAGTNRVLGLDIDKDKIVYSLHRPKGNAGPRSSLYLYDLTTMTRRRLSASPSLQRDVRISGNRVVWSDARNCLYLPVSCPNIFSYDLRADTEQQITAEQSYQVSPDVSGNRVVWLDYRNGVNANNGDIYLAELS